MASHLLPLTLSVTVVIDVRHAYIITLPALFINPSDYLTVTKRTPFPALLQAFYHPFEIKSGRRQETVILRCL